jgi:effector-binding domain-containing protein
MLTPPQLQYCDARPYAAIRTRLRPPAQVSALAPLMWAEVRSWLAFEGRLVAGPPFVRYHAEDPAGEVDVEAGMAFLSPLSELPARGAGRVTVGLLPAGEYATLLHSGPYDELDQARRALADWGRRHGRPAEIVEFYLRDLETEVTLHLSD